jgi:lipid-A-disaccharide synthase
VAHPRIFISCGETSGDVHGAALVRAILRAEPGAEIVAMGGPRLEAAGARLFANTLDLAVIGIAPIFGSVTKYLDLLSRADRFLGSWRPDVAVTIDFPGLHFLLANRLRARRVPALWYIPPQLWAWAPWRVKKLRRRYAKVACVLPVEEAFFRSHGVPAVLVGHPVVDHLRNLTLDQAFIRTLRPSADTRLIGIFPGSRRQEIPAILTRQLAVARALVERHPPCELVMAMATEEHRRWAAPVLAASGLAVRTVVGRTHEVQSAVDLALAKSGTTTLELLCYEKPMAVYYNVSPWQWNLVGRLFVRTPYLSLPNALAGRRIVPESMWNQPPTAAEINEVEELLVNRERRDEVRAELATIHRAMDVPGAAARVAEEVLGMVGLAVPAVGGMRSGWAV